MNVVEPKIWLSKNVQNNWWNELDWYQQKVESSFDAAHLYDHWRKYILKSNKINGSISEYKACRELLWNFYYQEGTGLFQSKNDSEFLIQDISIPSLTMVAFKNTLISFNEYFKMLTEIENFLDKIFLDPEWNQNLKFPLTYESYAYALQNQLLNIKTHMVEIENLLMKQGS